MSDVPRPSESIEQRLGLMARGVQRMADAFGAVEQRLGELADTEQVQAVADRVDEYRVWSRSEVTSLGDRLERLEVEQHQLVELVRAIEVPVGEGSGRPPWVDELVARIGAVEHRLSDRPAGLDLAGPMDRLIEAVLALRDDIAAAIGELRVETTAAVERVRIELRGQLAEVHEAVDAVPARSALPAAPSPSIDGERLAGIERVLASLRDELAIDRLEASLRDMAEDTSGLRADVRRSFDRVLHEISATEDALKGEVRAIDTRLAGFGEDLRLVRGLRDGLEALAAGVDAVRQLASRAATSTQMTEVAGELSMVLAEIESARSQVLSVDQQVGRLQAGTIEVAERAGDEEVRRDVEDLERKVTGDIADLGSRIEALAERTVASAEAEDPIGTRLRSLATSARQLSQGIAEDLKARRSTRRARGGKPR